MQHLKRFIVLISLTLVLSACGGGGGGSPASSTGGSTSVSNNSNWNQLTWDKDNWK